jgi:hypothetical protein
MAFTKMNCNVNEFRNLTIKKGKKQNKTKVEKKLS